MISLLEPIDRVNPTHNDRQPSPRRKGRKFPKTGDEAGDETEPETPQDDRDRASTPKPVRDDDDDEHIDIVVLGRVLPTRQAFPGAMRASLVH